MISVGRIAQIAAFQFLNCFAFTVCLCFYSFRTDCTSIAAAQQCGDIDRPMKPHLVIDLRIGGNLIMFLLPLDQKELLSAKGIV